MTPDMELTRAIMTDDSEVEINIDVRSVWLLLSACQMMTRHPHITDQLKDAYESIGHQLEVGVTNQHPAAADLIALGWDIDHDVANEDLS